MTNNELHQAQREAYERGYKEALLDVYLFLTGDESVFDIDQFRFDLILAMTESITKTSTGRLAEVKETLA